MPASLPRLRQCPWRGCWPRWPRAAGSRAAPAADGQPRYRLEQPLPALEADEILAGPGGARPALPALLSDRRAGRRALPGGSARSAQRRASAVRTGRHQRLGQVLLQRQPALRDQQRGRSHRRGASPAGGQTAPSSRSAAGWAAARKRCSIASAPPGALTQMLGYRFTEVSPLFLKRAQRTLTARYPQVPFSFATLDIDGPFTAGGVAPGSCSLIYGVNVLHVARDLAATLAQLREALRSDGVLVMAECVRPFAGMPLHLELVFNLLGSFRDAVRVPGWRPNGGIPLARAVDRRAAGQRLRRRRAVSRHRRDPGRLPGLHGRRNRGQARGERNHRRPGGRRLLRRSFPGPADSPRGGAARSGTAGAGGCAAARRSIARHRLRPAAPARRARGPARARRRGSSMAHRCASTCAGDKSWLPTRS